MKYYEYQLTKPCLEGRLEGFKVSSWFLKIMKLVAHTEYRNDSIERPGRLFLLVPQGKTYLSKTGQ